MAAIFYHSHTLKFAFTLLILSTLLYVLLQVAIQKLLTRLDPVAMFYPVTSSNTSHPLTSSATSRQEELSPSVSRQCQNVLRDMLNGRWYEREMTPDEIQRMRLFHRRTRENEHDLPRGNQRADKRCGNLVISKGLHNFRALCDEDGPTPCCYNFTCQNRTRQQCACDNCQDMRSPIHAEYATWRPWKASCQPRQWSVKDICHLLENSTLCFIGDSLIRHVFTALLLAARGNFETGAMQSSVSESLRSECSGLNMFSEKVCRIQLDHNPSLCNGSVRLEMCVSNSRGVEQIHEAVLALANTTRSLVFVGIGLHEQLTFDLVIAKVLQPLLQKMESQRLTSPRLLWAGIHQAGLMKSPFSKQNNVAIWQYNTKIREFLASYHVPVFDTYDLTHNVMSFDGTHYGYGVNAMKVNILLHYIQELKDQGKW